MANTFPFLLQAGLTFSIFETQKKEIKIESTLLGGIGHVFKENGGKTRKQRLGLSRSSELYLCYDSLPLRSL
jgi:hypothetical protein